MSISGEAHMKNSGSSEEGALLIDEELGEGVSGRCIV